MPITLRWWWCVGQWLSCCEVEVGASIPLIAFCLIILMCVYSNGKCQCFFVCASNVFLYGWHIEVWCFSSSSSCSNFQRLKLNLFPSPPSAVWHKCVIMSASNLGAICLHTKCASVCVCFHGFSIHSHSFIQSLCKSSLLFTHWEWVNGWRAQFWEGQN